MVLLTDVSVHVVWLISAAVCVQIGLLVTAQAKDSPGSGTMMWVAASNATALCNDYTRAGFFIRRNLSSNNWVVFLESGALCYNTESCNRRFFVRKVREEFSDSKIPEVVPYGSFDPSRVWNETIQKGRDPTRVISPLMTSMKCFENVTEYFPNGLSSSIEGRDILDPDPAKNHLFYSYNHVVIPYCSSDVWLGEETTNTEAVRTGTSQCDCFNYTTSLNQNGCFKFNPNSPNIPFTFRGKIIYHSIIRQLLDDYGMDNADKVILAGSSAGGLGVINHAKWTREVLHPGTKLMVFFDSAWFIDFQDSIEIIFNGETTSSSASNNQRLLDLLMSNSACNDTDRLGYPCCISAHCVMTQRNSDGELQYYPKDTPTFALFSIYDIYLLAPGLARVASLESSQETSNTGDGNGGVDIVLDILRVVGEYGGTMNNTLDTVTSQVSFLSYYVTQCFQHIYLATSTLWGADGQSVFGSDSLELTGGATSFSHFISSGRWNTLALAADPSRQPVTVFDALNTWMNHNISGYVGYRDICQGVLCNSQCPDKLQLGELTSNNWHTGIKIFIALLIAGLAVVCVAIKILFACWLLRLEKKQYDYINSLDKKLECTNQPTLQFPDCDDDDAISVSCLDLCYSVKTKALKDEKRDETAPVVLLEILEEEEKECSKENEQENKSWLQSARKSSVSLVPNNIVSAIRRFSTTSPTTTEPVAERKLTKQSNFDSEKELSVQPLRKLQSIASDCLEDDKDNSQFNILDGVSVFFNPGEMVGIMGPSGCGKTTFLDLLTGRRKTGTIKGDIYINGTPIDNIREWYIANTGYVLQLATPYYEELTVRENLTLAAQLKLPTSFTLREKFERIEQVMDVTGLLKHATTKVGGATGCGLSGGQKKRLVVALQLLNLPSVIFLDEPTSGLDASASYELLTHLNKLAYSNRTVILTIHQPRLEIFHMFHQLVLLSDGKVSYSDVPDKAYEVFVSALTSNYLKRGLVIPSLVKVHNPADVIMDMLGNPKMRKIITQHYQNSEEPSLIREEIMRARWEEYQGTSDQSLLKSVQNHICGSKQNSTLTRMAVLEARAAKRTWYKVAFLPIMFLIFGTALGTTYFQIDQAFLVVSGMCVFSTASALFMFPAMYLYYKPALEVYSFEKADGIGRSHDIVLQGFVRFMSIAFFPVILSVTVIYLLLVNSKSYDLSTYLQVLLVNIALNQTWIALLIALICAVPEPLRLSQVISATAGFSSGFFIPIGVLHWGYRWLVYINPNYYGLSSVAFFVLSEFQTDCTGNQLECYISSGPYILSQFFFDKINPYLHLLVLLGFTIFYLLLAILANWIRHTTITFKRISLIVKRSNDTLAREFDANHKKYENHFSLDREDSEECQHPLPTLWERAEEGTLQQTITNAVAEAPAENGESRAILLEEEGSEKSPTKTSKARDRWKKALSKSLEESETAYSEEERKGSATSLMNMKGENRQVWRPKRQPRLADLVASLSSQKKQRQTRCTSPPLSPASSKISLQSRQQMLQSRVQDRVHTTKTFFEDEILGKERDIASKPLSMFKEASKRVLADVHKNRMQTQGSMDLADVVSLYLAKMRAEHENDSKSQAKNGVSTRRGSHVELRKRLSVQSAASHGREGEDKPGTIPLDRWCKIVRENKVNKIRAKAVVETEV